MDKEDILEMSREENKYGKDDEMQKNAFAQASKIACAVGDIFCAILAVVALVLNNLELVPNIEFVLFTAWTVGDSISGTQKLVLYSKTKKKNDLIAGIIYLVTATACLAALVYFIVAGATI